MVIDLGIVFFFGSKANYLLYKKYKLRFLHYYKTHSCFKRVKIEQREADYGPDDHAKIVKEFDTVMMEPAPEEQKEELKESEK